MPAARRHRRLWALLAFALLALAAEIVGRGLVTRLDVGRHVESPSYADARYYPLLLAGMKVGIALLAARLVWRLVRARSLARAGARLLAGVGQRPRRAPRLEIVVSPRLWLGFFVLTSVIYLVQADAEGLAPGGRWPMLSPLLHTSALPVFAVLSVVPALLWGAAARWLSAYEDYALETLEWGHRLVRRIVAPAARPAGERPAPPRRLFGIAFDSRPPPLPA